MSVRVRRPSVRLGFEELESRLVPTTVNVCAPDSLASEAGDPAVFKFCRTGDLSQPLQINYSISGSAAPGTDFVPLAGQAVIPAGMACVGVVLNPLDDVAHESDETVTLSLLAGGYQIGTCSAATASLLDDDPAPPPAQPQPLPVLLVISNIDFYYQEYADTRAGLEEMGLRVEVAAPARVMSAPHWNSGQGPDGGYVMPDLALADADASRYSAIAFVGGWGASAYQYAFEGTYQFGPYNGDTALRQATNDLINDFVAEDKVVAAICHGVSVLAWARVDGVSPLAGRDVVAYGGFAPVSNVPDSTTTRWHVEGNGATMFATHSVGDPTTAIDDVVVDGRIITAENYDSARLFGRTIAEQVLATPETPPTPAEPLPVLLVIANNDFYYREYAETRRALEEAGIGVVVAAGTRTLSAPHWNSGQRAGGGYVMPDVALADVDASQYSAIVFVGGWGASQYQYGFGGTYAHGGYNASAAVEAAANRVLNDFVAQDKYIAGLCHGVTVLAWARVDGVSLLAGRTVVAYAGWAPASSVPGATATRWHVENNGATMLASQSVGNQSTAADDVWVDGKIITGENFDSSYRFGQVIAERLWA